MADTSHDAIRRLERLPPQRPWLRRLTNTATDRETLLVFTLASLFAALLLITVATGVRLWWIPEWQLPDATSPSDAVRIVNDYRLAVGPLFVGMLQALGGAAILYGLWLNVREHAFARVQHRAQRLKDATAQLESAHGSTRVAAVHEFENLAAEGEQHVPQILETLRLYIRDRAAPPDPAAPEQRRTLPDDIWLALAAPDAR